MALSRHNFEPTTASLSAPSEAGGAPSSTADAVALQRRHRPAAAATPSTRGGGFESYQRDGPPPTPTPTPPPPPSRDCGDGGSRLGADLEVGALRFGDGVSDACVPPGSLSRPSSSSSSSPSPFRRGNLPSLAALALVAALAGAAASVALLRLSSSSLSPEQALLAREYGYAPNFDGGGGIGIGGLPLLGKSRDRAKLAVRAQDEVRRYREAFLDRPELLDTEGEKATGEKGDKATGEKDDELTAASSSSSRIRAPLGCESTVVLLRHCEKGSIREHCAYAGYERSAYLATLFGDGEDERWPAPSAVYALNPGERSDRRTRNMREVETVRPLADKFGLTVDESYGLNEVNKLSRGVFRMLRSGDMCGKVAVVSWKHEDMPRLAQHLGCGPFEGCPMDYPSSTFDDAWLIKYVYVIPWNSERKGGQRVSRDEAKPTWRVFGSVQKEGFDPLAFSKRWGDYPPGGTETGGRWMPKEVRKEEETVVARSRWGETNKH